MNFFMTLGALAVALTMSLYALNLGPFAKNGDQQRKPQTPSPESDANSRRGFGRRSR